MKRYRLKSDWRTAPISPTCEVMEAVNAGRARYCGNATSHAYPADLGGWMALCTKHAKPIPEAAPIAVLLRRGETLGKQYE